MTPEQEEQFYIHAEKLANRHPRYVLERNIRRLKEDGEPETIAQESMYGGKRCWVATLGYSRMQVCQQAVRVLERRIQQQDESDRRKAAGMGVAA